MNPKVAPRHDDWVAATGPQEGPLTGRWLYYAITGVSAILILCTILTPSVSRGRPIARTTALVSVAKQGDVAHVQTYLNCGLPGFAVNARTAGGLTPLMAAAACGKVQVVELLLRRGADVTMRDVNGETALSLARRRGYGEVERLLQAGGARY